jgi:membrane-associated phospholipid phosphatase
VVSLVGLLVCLPAFSQTVTPPTLSGPAAQTLTTAYWTPGDLRSYPASWNWQFSAGSQDRTDSKPEGFLLRGLKRGLIDQKEIYAAPLQRSNLKWDALFLAGTGALIATDRQASRALPTDHLNASRHISDAGLIGTSAALGGIWLSSLGTKDPHARETSLLGAEAFANTAAVYAVTQLLAGRERPFQGTGNGRFWQNNSLNSSFPSGHAAFTWSMASVIAHEYPRPWVKWLAYGTAAAVSATRFTGREHFPSDVVVGSAFGYLIGTHIFHSHCKPGLSAACHSHNP